MCDRLLVCMYMYVWFVLSVCVTVLIWLSSRTLLKFFCKTYYLNKENNFKFFFQIVLKYLLVFFLLMCNKLVIFFVNTIISEGI